MTSTTLPLDHREASFVLRFAATLCENASFHIVLCRSDTFTPSSFPTICTLFLRQTELLARDLAAVLFLSRAKCTPYSNHTTLCIVPRGQRRAPTRVRVSPPSTS